MESEEGIALPKGKRAGSPILRFLKQRLPILKWGPKYNKDMALADLIAGITLGLTLVPQSIAYASLANLPVQYGLYSSFVGTMLYVFLGTVKEVSIGPTSLMALLTLQTCHGMPVEFVVLLTFLSGCVVLAMGLLKLGFLVDLISPTVTSGFTSATAIMIIVAQLKGLLGLRFIAESLVENIELVVLKIDEVRPGDCILGAVCCTILLLLRKIKDIPVSPKRASLKRALWLVSISRNALVVSGAALVAYATHVPGESAHSLFKLSGRVTPGLPPLAPPAFSAVDADGAIPFPSMVRRLGSGLLLMPLVMVLANIAIAKTFSAGRRVDASQEMVTLGLCNMAGSFFRAMPTCGAFTRSAVSHASGVRTPAAGLYSGIITLLALVFMTQYFYFIPKACLSSVLICAVIFMIDYQIIPRLWREDRKELVTLVITIALGVFYAPEAALLGGAAVCLLRLLTAVMRPPMHFTLHKYGTREVVVCRLSLSLVYVSAEYVAARLSSAPRRAALLVDVAQLALVDLTALQVLERLLKKFKEDDQQLIFYRASPEALKQLEKIEGINSRALRAQTIAEAMAVIQESNENETTALLEKNEV